MPKQATPLPQWQTPNIEPKRKFKFIMTLGDVPAWVVKTAGRPNVEVSTGATHQFLSHTFKYPGRVTWQDIEVTLVDPIEPDVAEHVLAIIEKAGYTIPSQWDATNQGWKTSLSKRRFSSNNLGDVAIKTIDSDGLEVERWTLKNVWVKSINYEDLDYTSEELQLIRLGLVYDYAEIKITSQGNLS